MKNILKIVFIIIGLVVFITISAFLHGRSLDNQIEAYEIRNSQLKKTADSLIADSHRTDEQSEEDIQLLDGVFQKMFTFYNITEFDEARDFAVRYNVPDIFVESFYNKSELSSMYADSMLDVLCKYKSADFYLLKRDGDTAYYYADVALSLVKFSGSFDLGIFVSVKSCGDETERITSMIYYYLN